MADRLPQELWTRIFACACMDDGYTSCSISLTSRYFLDALRPIRFHSISIRGFQALHALLCAFETQTPCSRRVHHLYISSDPPPPPENDDPDLPLFTDDEVIRACVLMRHSCADMNRLRARLFSGPRQRNPMALKYDQMKQDMEATFAHDLARILEMVAPSIHTLVLHMPQVPTVPPTLFVLSFPLLQEFVLWGNIWGNTPTSSEYDHSGTHASRFPRLKSLHMLGCDRFLETFLDAPALSYLRLSQVAPVYDCNTFRTICNAVLVGDEPAGGPRPLAHVGRIVLTVASTTEHLRRIYSPGLNRVLSARTAVPGRLEVLNESNGGAYTVDDLAADWARMGGGWS